MTAYLKMLNKHIEREHEAAQQKLATQNQQVKDRLTPLELRLTRLLATIPQNLQREGLSLPALQTALRGRWRGNCHPGELGAALRKLGFRRHRSWQESSGFRSVWRRP